MSLLFFDSFDHYATGDLSMKYFAKGGGAAIVATGRRGTSGITNWVTHQFAAPNTGRVTAGFAWKNSSYEGGCTFYGSDGYAQVVVIINGSGGFTIYRSGYNGVWTQPGYNGFSSEIGATANGVLSLNTWYYIEIQSVIDNTTGSVLIHVNGVNVPITPDLSSGIDTSQTQENCSGVGIICGGTCDDFYLLDDSGSDATDFLGDVRADAHFVISPDGANHAWTPSTGSDNYAMVDDTTPNTTDYNSTLTLDAVDTFHMEATKNPGARIIGVQAVVCHIKEDAGACLMAPVVITDGTTYVGSDFAPSESSYRFQRTIYELNPKTSLTWAEEDFDAVEIGYKKTG